MTAAADANVPEPVDRRTQIFRICIGLVLATWVAFEAVLRSSFVDFDDPRYVTDNFQVLAGFTRESVAWAFSSTYLQWHPVTWLSHMLDVQLFGLAPRGHHLTNLVLHIANVLLLFGLLTRATGAVRRSAVVAALFGLHPLHVEPVAWISERKEVLSTLFGLLALWAYVAYARRGGVGRYLLTAALFAVGLMAKPMLVTLPFVFLLLDYWPLDRLRVGRGARVLIEKIPFLALSAVSSAIVLTVQRGSIWATDSMPLSLRAANALVSYLRYIAKMLWPTDLSVLYLHPNLPGGTPWAAWQVVGAGMLLLAISLLATRRRYALMGWLWYLGTLIPVIGLVRVGFQAMADRYTYVPLIGLFVILVWGGAELIEKIPSRGTRSRRATVACTVALLLVCLVWTRVQTFFWTNSLTLYARALAVEPANPVIHYQLALTLRAGERVDEAVSHFRRALEVDPDFARARHSLAATLAEMEEVDESIDEYRRLLQIDPDGADAHSDLGAMLEVRGDHAEAISHYRRALEIRPDYPEAHFNLGNALLALGESDEAIAHYRRALEIRPDYLQAHFNLGNALRDHNEPDEAVEHYRESVRLNPGFVQGYFDLGNALAILGEMDEAIESYREALRLKPDFALAHNNLGSALMARDELDEAAGHFREALTLNPDLAVAQENLDRLLERKDTVEQAP
jgi:tetratricopeptide (TPR) repeat protein